ncbi:MAG: M24 family metallopeptidase [Vicinamibacterales bacterium]|nr:M24 family metallopeptidase [Vicinamibacterales bacterium]
MPVRAWLLCLSLLLTCDAAPAAAQNGDPFDQGRLMAAADGHVLPQRERVAAVNRMLRDRLDTLLPALMRETGIDFWVVINREYAEDPLYLTLVPEPVFAARRTTMLVFHDRGGEAGVERLTVSRYPMPGFYEPAWEGGEVDEQWARLGAIIAERNPRRIGVNTSRDWAFGDGLSSGMRARLMAVLPEGAATRVVSAEALAVRWLESRTALELEVYPHIVGLARGVIAEAFSPRVITPGVTTTDDVAWYIRQRFADLDLPAWFMPNVNRQRPGTTCDATTPFCGDSGVIDRGDVLHTDVGVTYLRLATDTQEMGYVLRLGETDVPEGLKRALAVGNRWQDLLTAEFRVGRSGNEVLAALQAAARREGIDHNTYTHPIGFHGHGAGATIGMWDTDAAVPIHGDWPLHANTGFSIEGGVKVAVPEWQGQLVNIKLEQTSVFDGERVIYLAGRQTRWHVVP